MGFEGEKAREAEEEKGELRFMERRMRFEGEKGQGERRWNSSLWRGKGRRRGE